MNIEIVDTPDERTYIIKDDMISSRVMKFEEELNDFIRDDDRDVIIDMANITKIDSMSIAAIIRVKNKLTEDERNLKLINPNDGVMRVLELAGLETFLLG